MSTTEDGQSLTKDLHNKFRIVTDFENRHHWNLGQLNSINTSTTSLPKDRAYTRIINRQSSLQNLLFSWIFLIKLLYTFLIFTFALNTLSIPSPLIKSLLTTNKIKHYKSSSLIISYSPFAAVMLTLYKLNVDSSEGS
jgi:hypothetical protein